MKNLHFLPTILSATLILSFTSCVSNREQVWNEKRDPAQNRTRQWAKICSPYAKMASLAYKDNGPTSMLDTVEDASESQKANRFFMKELKKENWKLVGNCKPGAHDPGKGLYFDVWGRNTGPQKEYVFAFRGTEGRDIGDWISNFRWIRWGRHVPQDQYTIARDECLKTLRMLVPDSELMKVRVVTTGHSLGGGIAQTVFYNSIPYVDQSIVFDTSPVTGISDLSLSKKEEFFSLPYRETFPHYRIIRAYARGEILFFLRNITQVFYHDHTLIHNVEFDMEQGRNAISKHSMRDLAYSIHYSATYAPPVPPLALDLPPSRKPTYFHRHE